MEYFRIFFSFRIVGVGALLATAISTFLIIIQIVRDGIEKDAFAEHVPHGFKDLFTSFGVILFAFGGSSTFPTIQNDMINRNKFPKSVIIAFTCKFYQIHFLH